MVDITSGLTQPEEEQLIRLLQKMQSPLSTALFTVLAAKIVVVAIETVILRQKDSQVQVLLTERPPDDPIWKGKLHSPGTILRPSDMTYHDAFERIQQSELKMRFKTEPVFVCTWLEHMERGAGNGLVFMCQVEGEPVVGQFYDVDNLPPALIATQINMIKSAVDHFKRTGYSYE